MGCTQSKEKKEKKLNKTQSENANVLVDPSAIKVVRGRIHHGENDDGETMSTSTVTSADSENSADSAEDKTVVAAAARRRTDNLGILASPSQQKIISRSTTPMRQANGGRGGGFGNGDDDAADFSGMSPVNLNQTNVRQSDSASLLSESVKFRSCASRFGGGATTTAMSSALINSQYFYSFATTENGESGILPGLRIEYTSSQQEIYDPHGTVGMSNTVSLSQTGNLHTPMSPSQIPSRRMRLNATNGATQEEESSLSSPPPPHIRTDTGALGPLSSSEDDNGALKTDKLAHKSKIAPSPTVASSAGLSMLSPQTLNTPGILSDVQVNQFSTTIHIRTQSAATNASVNTTGAAPTPRYYGSDEDSTPTTTIYHEKLSAMLSAGPGTVAPNNNGRVSPSNAPRTDVETLAKVESDDGSDHDGSPTVERLGKDVAGFEPQKATKSVQDPTGSDDERLETTLGTGQKKKLEEVNATYINKLSVVAQGTDPASRYVKAKLAMGTERPKEGKGFDMSVFRVGCDSIAVSRKPDFHLYNPATDPLLQSAKGRRASDASSDGIKANKGPDFRSTTTDDMSFADMLNPTCTWDLLHSIPDAISKVNNGDLLYRFCAKKYKDLPLEERVEIASHINMTGFKDELAENDQPILDFVHNKNSVAPTQDGISAAAALDAKIAKHLEKEKKNGVTVGSSSDHAQTPATEVEDINLDNVLVCVLRLVGIMPRVTSRDANVDCVMNTDFQRLLAAPDEVFEHIDRYRTFRKVKHIIPFVFSFRFQMTGSELVDDETMAEHAHHHDAKPTRIVVTERTKKHRGTDSTIKSKAFFTFYDIPPRGISSITGKPLAPELAEKQSQELLEVSERLGGQSPEDIPTEGKGKKKNKNAQSKEAAPQQGSSSQLIPEKPGGILCVHTAIIIRTSMPKVLAGMVEAVGNKMGKQATGQIFKVRQFLLERKLSGWSEMATGGDNPNVKFIWEQQQEN